MSIRIITTYRVGGSVRDELLGLTPKDVDYVVVGATPADLLSRGYKPVGADFPVFLHPETGEEYALARTERKSAPGYHGFEVSFDTTVTLAEDLARRDLTINAMARDLATGELIDPYGGQADLAAGLLRHTSEAFAEDPVRVLRTARFAARYDFDIHPDTMSLMREVVPELEFVPQERVWAEFEKGLSEANPARMMEVLEACGALQTTAMRPYAGWNFRLANTTAATPLHVKFALAAYRFTKEDYPRCRVPSPLAKISRSFDAHGLRVLHYVTQSAEERLSTLMLFRALADTDHLMRVVAVYDAFDGDVDTAAIRVMVLRDVAACATVPAEEVAKLAKNKSDIPRDLFSARVGAMSSLVGVTGYTSK